MFALLLHCRFPSASSMEQWHLWMLSSCLMFAAVISIISGQQELRCSFTTCPHDLKFEAGLTTHNLSWLFPEPLNNASHSFSRPLFTVRFKFSINGYPVKGRGIPLSGCVELEKTFCNFEFPYNTHDYTFSVEATRTGCRNVCRSKEIEVALQNYAIFPAPEFTISRSRVENEVFLTIHDQSGMSREEGYLYRVPPSQNSTWEGSIERRTTRSTEQIITCRRQNSSFQRKSNTCCVRMQVIVVSPATQEIKAKGNWSLWNCQDISSSTDEENESDSSLFVAVVTVVSACFLVGFIFVACKVYRLYKKLYKKQSHIPESLELTMRHEGDLLLHLAQSRLGRNIPVNADNVYSSND